MCVADKSDVTSCLCFDFDEVRVHVEEEVTAIFCREFEILACEWHLASHFVAARAIDAC